ncbi:MAG: dihydroorotate dehydrogenase [Thermodesulfobacteriota bacterium]|nr:dihydroorotate dehydrogenase [Thermodesulfobacteriota bacterium]
MKSNRALDLSINIGKMKLKNPVITASGTFGYGQEYEEFLDLSELGAIIPKGISLKPMAGNPPPRIFETNGGILNSIGLQNPGLQDFVREKLPYLNKIKTDLIINFFGNTQKEYVELAKRLDSLPGISGLEMNISCPNVKHGGIVFGSDPRMTYRLVSAVRKSSKLPFIVKLSPNVTDISAIAKSAEEGGADAVSLINTFKAMAINIITKKPELGNVMGGLSGPAIKPIAVRMVWEVSQAVKIPVIGIGGIIKAEDAIEFILAGASAIQIGTANLINPGTGIEVISGLKKYLIQNKINQIKDLIGLFKIQNSIKSDL